MNKEQFDKLYGNSIMGAILDCSFDGYSYTDEMGNILYCNPAYYCITGLPVGTIAGRSVHNLVRKGYPVSAMTLEVMKTQRPLSRIIRYHVETDNECLVTMVPVYDTNHVFIGTVANYRNLTALNDMRVSLEEVELKYNEMIHQTAAENLELWNKINVLQTNLGKYHIYGDSKVMRNLIEFAERICHVHTSVLITGESGVGKDVFCKLVHQFSGTDKPFIKISCGVIPENLLESELFGYEPGAFTGASKTGKLGIFELAKDGTVFLDEIGEMPLSLQVKLLTVLQDRKFFRVGGTKEQKMDARILAATNRDLKHMLADGTFRSDLYYRINVIPVYIPPLRERKDDILPIADGILEKFNQENNTRRIFSADVQRLIWQYDWPGNIRELNNVVERMYVLSQNDIIGLEVLPQELLDLANRNMLTQTAQNGMLREKLESIEATLIRQELQKEISVRQVADNLGIDVSTLERKINKYHLTSRYKKKKYRQQK